MKFFTLLVLSALLSQSAAAQHRDEQLTDSVIGWSFGLPKPPHKGISSRGRTLTPKQKENTVKVMDWMMQSYTPVGGIGTFKTVLNLSGKLTYPDYSQHSYWIDFRVWNVSLDDLDEKGHLKGVNEEYHLFRTYFNSAPGMAAVYYLNSPGNYYFTYPPDNVFRQNSDKVSLKNTDPRINANCSRFIINNQSLVLAPGNKLPFIPVTIAEYLNEAEASLPRNLELFLKEVDERFRADNQQGLRDANRDNTKKDFAGYAARIKELREKYRNRLNEQAILNTNQSELLNFRHSDDPLEITSELKAKLDYYPLYKMDPVVLQKSTSDQPQFISFSLPYYDKEDGEQLHELYMALTQNVNYQYIYDYFFDPLKVKGKVYVPFDAAGLKARLASYSSNKKLTAFETKSKVEKLSANVLLNENFSNTIEGRMPAGWWARSIGKSCFVTTLPGLEGKWLKAGAGNKITPTTLPKTLPENFTMEFDAASSAEFSGRTGAMLRLRFSNSNGFSSNGDEKISAEGQSFDLLLTAGNETDRVAASNFRGEVAAELHQAGGPNRENYKEGLFYKRPLPEFTGKNNRVHVTVKIQGGQCRVLINGKPSITPADFKQAYGSACTQCGLKPGMKFSLVYFTNVDNSGEDNPVYISNIKIIKD